MRSSGCEKSLRAPPWTQAHRSIMNSCGSIKCLRRQFPHTNGSGFSRSVSGMRFPPPSIDVTWSVWFIAALVLPQVDPFPLEPVLVQQEPKIANYDPAAALRSLQQDGFRREEGVLKDRSGNAVEFSVITNAGSKVRVQLGSMLQEDLAKIGIKVNIVQLEFRSLLERIQKTANYEACILGLANIELDPNAQMNVLTSAGTHHPWHPRQAARQLHGKRRSTHECEIRPP